MVHRFVINSMVMWLHILVGPCWCVYVALSTSEQCNTHTDQKGPLSICSHITAELNTDGCTIIGYFNKCNFSKHE